MTHRDDDDEAVGYGKPPKKHRFKKGQSGNPKGRRKGSRNFATCVDEVLKQRMTITENGTRKKVTTQEAALRKLAAKALKGETRSLDRFLALAAERSVEKEAQSAERTLKADEEDILERFLEANKPAGSQEGGGPR